MHAAQVGVRREYDDLDRLVVVRCERERKLLHEGDRLEVVEVHLPVAGHEWLALRLRHDAVITGPGPMSSPLKPAGIASAPTVCVSASSCTSRAITTSTGRKTLPESSSRRHASTCSSSSNESPTG